MKKIILGLSAIVLIVSAVLIGCNKQELINSSLSDTKTDKKQRFKYLTTILGIEVEVTGASGCMHKEFYPNGTLKKYWCSDDCLICWLKIKVKTGVAPAPVTGDELFNGRMTIHSLKDVTLNVKPEHCSPSFLQAISNGSLTIESEFGIGYDYTQPDAIIIPAGVYPVVSHPDGSKTIRFKF